MTRTAVRDGFARYVDQLIEVTLAEFDVAAALSGRRGPGGLVVNRLLKNSDALDRRVVRPEIDRYRGEILAQFDVCLDYATDPDPDEADYRERWLDRDMYLESLREGIDRSRREEIREELVARQRGMAESVRPVVGSDRDSFWPAVVDALDREETETLIEANFRFTEPIRERPDAFRFETTFDAGDVVGGPLARGLPTVTVDYTDEARRTMRRAEERVVRDVEREAARRFEAAD